MDQRIIKKVTQKIASYRTDIIDLQRKLTSYVALSPENGGIGEVEKAEFLKSFLENIPGLKVEEIRAPDKRVPCGYRPNLVAKFGGVRKGRTVWIMSHMDVVPPGDLSHWRGDPYEVWIEDNFLYGRGVEDNQQGIVSSIFAMKALIELGMKPAFDAGLVLVADEETGSKFGIDFLLASRKDLFGQDDIIIIPDAGNEDGTMIEVAEKSIVWLRIITRGRQCHASTPERGVNAFSAASNLVVRLSLLYEEFGEKDALFDPPISTFEPTKKEANVPNVNTIPGEDVFYLDSRILPQYDVRQVMERIAAYAQEIEEKHSVKVEIEPVQIEAATKPTPSDAPVVKALQKAIIDLRGKEAKPKGIGGGTVAAYFRRRGYHAAVWSTLDELAHQPNEYCKISNIIEDSKVFAHVFLQGS
jgi:succinyl-diaminopimelate desuccinylase